MIALPSGNRTLSPLPRARYLSPSSIIIPFAARVIVSCILVEGVQSHHLVDGPRFALPGDPINDLPSRGCAGPLIRKGEMIFSPARATWLVTRVRDQYR